MSGDGKFQQIWNFRSRDDIDSSSDDSKSNSKGEPKNDLASALIFVGNDENSDDPGYGKIGQVQLQPGEGVQSRKSRPKKQSTTKARGKKSKTERKTETTKARGKKSKAERKTQRGSKREIGEKRKFSALNPALLDEFKIFTESLIQDLKVKREQMFAQMKEDMQKLVSVESSTRQTTKPKSRKRTGGAKHAKSTESDMIRPWNCSDGTLGRSIVSSWLPDSNNHPNALDERVNHDQAVQNISSNKKEKGEHVGLLAKQSVYACNQPDQFVASSYMTLPSPPSGKLLEHQNTESPFRNGISTGLACDRRNLMINTINHPGYISGSQVEVPFPGFAQMGTKYVRFNDQHCTQSSSMRNGFPLPFHQRLESTFNIPSQPDNLSGGNNMLGWRMNGGTIGFSGNGHNLPDNIATSSVRNRVHCIANEEVNRYGMQDLRDGNFN